VNCDFKFKITTYLRREDLNWPKIAANARPAALAGGIFELPAGLRGSSQFWQNERKIP